MSPTSGVVLAGGQSRRMGRDKARLRLPVAGRQEAAEEPSLLSVAVERMAQALGVDPAEILVARGPRGAEDPSEDDGIGQRVDDADSLLDPQAAASAGQQPTLGGPSAGILGAAAARPGHALLVFACDLPAVPASLLARLLEQPGDLVVPTWTDDRGIERHEPLVALYRPGALAALARLVADRRATSSATAAGREVRAVGPRALLGCRGLAITRWPPPGDPTELFRNLNAPADVADWLAALRQASCDPAEIDATIGRRPLLGRLPSDD